MKELKEEAKRHHEAKLHKYGASEEERKACGGSMKRAHGGKVEHPHEKKDKHLAKEIKHEAEEIERDHEGKKHGGHVHHRVHRVDGGPVPRLGRGRKGGKGKTSVNIAIGKPGGDSAGAPPMMPPPALGAAGPSGPLPVAPKPMIPPMGPRPMPPAGPAGPMKHGGHVKKHHGEHEKKHEHKRHHEHRGHSGHRG